MKKLVASLLILVGFSLSPYAILAQDTRIQLSVEERAWLEAHPVIRVGNENDWPPFDFAENGEPRGYSIDFLKLVGEKVGLQFEFVNGFTWSQLLDKARNRELDILPAIMETPERREFLDFTQHYMVNPTVIVTKETETGIHSITDLKGRSVAIVRGYYYENSVKSEHPDIEIVSVSGFLEGLEAVVHGSADAFIGSQIVVHHTITSHFLGGLRVAGRSGIDDVDRFKIRFGVAKGENALISILEKGMNAITRNEKQKLAARWIGAPAKGNQAVGAGTLDFQTDVDIAAIKQLRDLAQEIESLDAILTTSALTFALTEDVKWLSVYEENEVKLGTLLEDALARAGKSDAVLLNRMSRENDELVSMEVKAIALAKDGKGGDGADILNSKKYQDYKRRLRLSMGAYFQSLEEQLRTKHGPQKASVILTDEEKAWIQSRTIKVGVEQWAPIVYADSEGNIQGIAGGFLRMVTKSTGLKFEVVSDEWDPLLKGLENKTIDLLPATYYTDERSTYGLYTEPYFFMREFIYVKDGNQEVKSIDDLADKRIAVVKGYGTIPKIRSRYPHATIVETKDLLASIDAVLNGDVAALIEAQMAVEHTIKLNSIIGLKGISQNVFKASPVHFFSRIDEPLLRSILQKGLDAISEDERRAEMAKWVTSAETERDKLRLSPAQQLWLSKHETIRLGIDRSWPPVEFVDDQGKYAGVSSGYVDAISRRLEVTMEPMRGLRWSEVIEKVKKGEVDVLPAVARTPEREANLNFTEPYINIPLIIATDKNGPIVSDMGDLQERTVGVVKGYAAIDLLRADLPELQFIEMSDIASLLEALSAGKVDTVFGNLWAISYEKERLGLENVKVAMPTSYNVGLSLGVRKDWPELVPILNKALAAIDNKERTAIKNTWLAVEVKFGTDLKTILIWALPIGAGLGLIIVVIVISNRRLSLQIAERKRAERALKESEAILSTILDNMPAIVFLKELDGSFIRVNQAYEDRYGVDRHTIAGKSLYDLMDKNLADKLTEFDRQVLARGGRNEQEHTVSNPDGDVTFHGIMFPVIGEDGEITAYGGVEIDITERKQIELALSESEKQLRSILEASPIGVAISVDDQSADDGVIEFANSRFKEMLEFSEADIGTKRTDQFFPKSDDRDEHERLLDAGHALTDMDVMVRRMGSGQFPALLSISPIQLDGRQSALIWLYDITQLKNTEEQLKDAIEFVHSSIEYASNIQRSVLPDDSLFSALLSDYFVLWEPRDVVGGDMYWCRLWGDGLLLILGDCTGHGVPGAFMTLIATGALDNALTDVPAGQVALLMQRVHQLMQLTLGQHGETGPSDDGMELGMCFLSSEMDELTFVGAKFELFLVESGQVSSIRGTKSGIGYRGIDHDQIFDEHKIINLDKKAFYMTSDGVTDQVGGDRKRMFGKKRFKELLADIASHPMSDQKAAIYESLLEYQGDDVRRDDISVVGFRV